MTGAEYAKLERICSKNDAKMPNVPFPLVHQGKSYMAATDKYVLIAIEHEPLAVPSEAKEQVDRLVASVQTWLQAPTHLGKIDALTLKEMCGNAPWDALRLEQLYGSPAVERPKEMVQVGATFYQKGVVARALCTWTAPTADFYMVDAITTTAPVVLLLVADGTFVVFTPTMSDYVSAHKGKHWIREFPDDAICWVPGVAPEITGKGP